MRGRHAFRILLLWVPLLLQGPPGTAAERPLSDDEVVLNPGSGAAFAPNVVLGPSPVLATVAAAGPNDCAVTCQARPDCGWFNHCSSETGCARAGKNGTTLGYRQCLLMAAGCTLVPPVLERPALVTAEVIAGFPIRTDPPPPLPGLVLRSTSGMVGGDFECGSAMVPGKCAFPSALSAAGACTNSLATKCRAVMVYENGTDGCSGFVAILKNSNLAPANGFVGPTVYVLERAEGAPTGGFLLASEAIVIETAPTNGTAADGWGGNNTWLGYYVAAVPALAAGDIIATQSGVASVEACAKECRKRSPQCNVYNYCAVDAGVCSFKDLSTEVNLQPQQCELRFQTLADPSQGGPPYLLARDEAAGGFQTGSPLIAWGPELPGYKRHLGSGLFGQPGYVCPDSKKPDLQECLLLDPLEVAGQRCTSDPACKAIIYKPTGVLGSPDPVSMLRRAEGANISSMIATPTAVIYEKVGGEDESGGGGGLSTGAIAGIAAGAAVAAVAAVAAGWVMLRRRWQRSEHAGSRAVSPSASAKGVGGASAAAATDDKLLTLEAGGVPGEVHGGPPHNGLPESGATTGSSHLTSHRSAYCGTLGMAPAVKSGSPVLTVSFAVATTAATLTTAGATAAAAAAAAGAPSQQQLKSSTAGSSGSGASSQPLTQVAISRPTAASPFASMRQARMGGGGSGPGWGGGQAGGTPLSGGGGSGWGAGQAGGTPFGGGAGGSSTWQASTVSTTVGSATSSRRNGLSAGPSRAQTHPEELTEMMTELLAYHAQEEEAFRSQSTCSAAQGFPHHNTCLPFCLSSFLCSAPSCSTVLRRRRRMQPPCRAPRAGIPAAHLMFIPLFHCLQYRAEEEEAAGLPRTTSGHTSGDTGVSAVSAVSAASSSRMSSGCVALPPSLQAWLIPRHEIELQRRPNGELAVLGEGASGRVIRALYHGELVAAKEMDIGRGLEVQEEFLLEAQRMQSLRHAHLITFYGMAVDGNRGTLVMELCEGQDLGSVLRLRDASGQRLFGWHRHGCRIACEVATALNYLHSKGVVHMDIKSSNVLLSGRGVAKLSDVGVSRCIDRTFMSDLPQLVGTFAWVAPEILMGGHHCTQAVDMFSFSVLLWEIITGERPVRGHMRQPRVPEECPQEAADLMAACSSLEPTQRPTAQQVMQRLREMREAQRSR